MRKKKGCEETKRRRDREGGREREKNSREKRVLRIYNINVCVYSQETY